MPHFIVFPHVSNALPIIHFSFCHAMPQLLRSTLHIHFTAQFSACISHYVFCVKLVLLTNTEPGLCFACDHTDVADRGTACKILNKACVSFVVKPYGDVRSLSSNLGASEKPFVASKWSKGLRYSLWTVTMLKTQVCIIFHCPTRVKKLYFCD